MSSTQPLLRHPRTHLITAAIALVLSAPVWAGEVCDTTAAGEYGNGSTATGSEAFACGLNNQARDHRSNAFGDSNTANGQNSNAFGTKYGLNNLPNRRDLAA